MRVTYCMAAAALVVGACDAPPQPVQQPPEPIQGSLETEDDAEPSQHAPLPIQSMMLDVLEATED